MNYCLTVLIIISLIGCSTTKEPTQFVFDKTPLKHTTLSLKSQIIGITNLTTPAEMQSLHVFYTKNKTEGEYLSKYEWSGGFQAQLTQFFLTRLKMHLPNVSVYMLPWPFTITPEVFLNIDVTNVALNTSGRIQLTILYSLSGKHQQKHHQYICSKMTQNSKKPFLPFDIIIRKQIKALQQCIDGFSYQVASKLKTM